MNIFEEPQPKQPTLSRFLGCVGFCVGAAFLLAIVFFSLRKKMEATEPYKTAVVTAINSSDVQAALGAPITSGKMANGQVNFSGEIDNLDVTVPLSGSKASGSLHYAATKENGRWIEHDFTVTVKETNQKIRLWH